MKRKKEKEQDFSYATISIGLAYDINDMRKLILRAPSRRQSHVTIYVWSTFPYLQHENFANHLSVLDSNYTLNHQFHDDHCSISILQVKCLFHDNEILLLIVVKTIVDFIAQVFSQKEKKINININNIN